MWKASTILLLQALALWLFADAVEAGALRVRPKDRCHEKFNGTVESLTIYDGFLKITGLTREMCIINVEGNMALLGIDTVGKTRSIAASYLKHLAPIDASKLDFSGQSNPAMEICSKLGGSQAGFSGELSFAEDHGIGNQYDACVFGDGSTASAWTIYYTSLSVFDGFTVFNKQIRAKISEEMTFPDVQPKSPLTLEFVSNTTQCSTDADCADAQACGTNASVCGNNGVCVPKAIGNTCSSDTDCASLGSVFPAFPVTNPSDGFYCSTGVCSTDNTCTCLGCNH